VGAPLAVAALSTCAATQPSPTPSSSPSIQVIGTVTAVSAQKRTFDVVTGVGLSLRVHHIVQPAGLKIEPQAGAPAIAALYPGCVVRVDCNSAPTGTVASRIELLRAPSVAGKP